MLSPNSSGDVLQSSLCPRELQQCWCAPAASALSEGYNHQYTSCVHHTARSATSTVRVPRYYTLARLSEVRILD